MSRELMIAMGTVSLAILGFLVARWDATLAVVMRQKGVGPRLSALVWILCLVSGPFVAAAAAATNGARGLVLLGYAQLYGVSLGTIVLVVPLIAPILFALHGELNDRARFVGWVILRFGPLVAAFTVLIIFVWPWYVPVAIFALAGVIARLEMRYGSPIERLLGRKPEDR